MKHLSTFFSAALLICAVSCSPGSEPAGKRTEALDDSAWENSVWISAADAPVITDIVRDGTRSADGASWFIGTVKNEKKVISAKWMTTGLGVYELYVNGKIIGNEILKPGFTHPFKTKRSFTYDVTEVFKTKAGAENKLSAQLTPGWWADKIVTPSGTTGMLGSKCAFRSVLEITYLDGSKCLFGTDTENWKAGIAGPVKHASIFDGEEYDARELPGFMCEDKFGKPELNTTFQGEILPNDGAEVFLRKDLAFKPAEAYVWNGAEGASEEEYGKVSIVRSNKTGEEISLLPGETLVVDFGQNCAAVPEFEFKAAEGTVLTCLPAELINDGNGSKSRGMDGPGGSCHRTNLRVPKTCMIVSYTFAGKKGYEKYRPSCTFFGYRFVSVTASAEVKIKTILSVPVTSISESLETGKVVTGNELINRLISNTVWGQKSNYLSVPTDCPQRNERLGWTADTQVFTETGTFFANTRNFFHKWMRDMRDTQSPAGGFPGVAPWAQYGAMDTDMMRLGWADAGIIVPWTVWKQYDDKSIIDENWAAMEKFMNHINETNYSHESLAAENGNYQWADWLSFEALESHDKTCFIKDKNNKTQPIKEIIEYWNYLCASYWALDSEKMKDMAAATGRDTAKYEEMQAKAKSYLIKNFFNPDGSFKLEILNEMQTPALFALKNNLFEGTAKEAIIARLRENFKAKGNCLSTGFLGTSILMPTLTENGMVDIAYELLFQRKNPSWLYSIENGATTIWERWNSYTLENGMGPKGMNSFNHYAYGCVCQWIWQTCCGIESDIAAPGFKHIIMKPIPDKRLGSLDSEFKSAAGLIRSSWKYDGDKWIWNFTVPEGSTASVTLPGETESKEYTSGTYTIEK